MVIKIILAYYYLKIIHIFITFIIIIVFLGEKWQVYFCETNMNIYSEILNYYINNEL